MFMFLKGHTGRSHDHNADAPSTSTSNVFVQSTCAVLFAEGSCLSPNPQAPMCTFFHATVPAKGGGTRDVYGPFIKMPVELQMRCVWCFLSFCNRQANSRLDAVSLTICHCACKVGCKSIVHYVLSLPLSMCIKC
jgi:hypothetical protein